jgi:thiol:disulfide interchange protein
MNRLLPFLLASLAGLSAPNGAVLPIAGGLQEQHAKGKLFVQRPLPEEIRLAIELKVDPKWHLYHGPTPDDVGSPYAVPTDFELPTEGFEWGPPVFPKPGEEKQITGEVVKIHHGTLVVFIRGKVVDPARAAEHKPLTIKATGQTCTSGEGATCLPYDEELEEQPTVPEGVFKDFPTGASAAPTAPASGGPAGATGLGTFLLLAVGWGLFTLLMPCTYPMIPITISFFTKQAIARQGKVLPLSLAYGAGIVIVFVAIGVVIGKPILQFATHPVTNLVIAGFFLLFALALFGVLELKPPRFLLSAAGSASQRGGFGGVFLMGATLVVTSFTCTAPFVGSLLSVGAQTGGGLAHIALGMGVFGATMAVPFVLLSLLPGKLHSIPRSGEWMHSLKVTLGFVEVAAALKFLSNADLVWGWGFLSRELFLLLWFGIFLVAALYLFGIFRLTDEARTEISPLRMVFATVVFLLSLYFGYGVLGNPMDPITTAIMPNYSNGVARSGAGRGAQHEIVVDDYDAALAQARKEQKGLLVNFTGHT